MKHEITSLSFAGGLNLKADPKVVKENQTTIADNVIYQTAGIVRKRNGFTTLGMDLETGYIYKTVTTSTGTITVRHGNALANVNGELCFTDDKSFYTYSPLTNKWTQRGDVSETKVEKNVSMVSDLKQVFTTSNLTNLGYADIDDVRCVVANINVYIPTFDEFYARDIPSVGNDGGAVVGFWDKSKNEWIMPPFKLDFSSFSSREKFAYSPVVVAYDRTFRIHVQVPHHENVDSDMRLYIGCIDADAIIAGTYDYATTVNQFTVVPDGAMACFGVREDANGSGIEYGYFPDDTHGLDACVSPNLSFRKSYCVVTGPLAGSVVGTSGGFLATLGTTGPAVNKILQFDTPTSVVPSRVGTTALDSRLHVAANGYVVISGYVGTQATAAVLVEFDPTNPIPAPNLWPIPFPEQISQGGAFVLTGLALDSFSNAIGMFSTRQALSAIPTDAPVPNSSYGFVPFSLSRASATYIITPGTPCVFPASDFCGQIDPLTKPVYTVDPTADFAWNEWVRMSGGLNGGQEEYALLDLTNFKTRTRVAYQTAKPAGPMPPDHLADVWRSDLSPTVLGALAFNENTSAVFEFPNRLEDMTTEAGFTASPTRKIIPLDKGAFITGSRPSYYDGVTVRELGFDSWPELNIATVAVVPTTPVLGLITATSGQLTPASVYRYTGIFRYFDNVGRQVLSAPFPTSVIATTPVGTIGSAVMFHTKHPIQYMTDMFAVNPLSTNVNPNFVSTYTAVLYRTTADDSQNYRELGLWTTSPSVVAGFVTFIDNTSDTVLRNSGLPFLYGFAGTGELTNDPPPACSIAIASQQRLYVVSDETPTRIYFSKPFAANRAPEFNYLSFIEIDPNSGPITGLGLIDSNLVVFKERVIYVVTGTGPNAAGQGAFNDPSILWSEDGCIAPNSVVVTSMGIFYQSKRGIQLLNRSQTNEYVGALVESYTRDAIVTSALIVAARSQIRFFMSDGTVLVYDYLLQLWSRFVSDYDMNVNASTLFDDKPTFLEHYRDSVMFETDDLFRDDNPFYTAQPFPDPPTKDPPTPVTLTLETGWIKFSGLQTWNRLRRVSVLGDYKSENTAELSLAYDYTPTYVNTLSFATGTVIDTPGAYQWRARAPRQVMQAVRFKLVDTTTATTSGESYNLTGLTLEWATKGGIARQPDNKSK